MAGPSNDDELLFDDAADFVAAQVTGKNPAFTDAHKLALYGLYKQAVSGPCSTKKPGIFDPSGRSKWDAWSKVGDLPHEAAKRRYVHHVASIDPEWQSKAGDAGGRKKGMGAVFSAFAYNDESAEDNADVPAACPLHEAAGAGDAAAVSRLLSEGAQVDARDDVGATPLHFAADRGCLDVMKLLVASGAGVDACDEDGCSPLHYASLTGHAEAFRLLVSLGADVSVQDADGQTPKPPA